MGARFLIFHYVQNNYQFVGERYIDLASHHKGLNPTTSAPYLL
jgi:hypothetical protein